jgi:signal peptidase I
MSATAVETSSPTPRRPWLAGLLSLFGGGPLGQIYVGRLRRSLCLWIVGGCLLPTLAFSAVALPIGRWGLVVLVFCAAAFPVCLAVDAFLLAKRNREALPKRYQRWWSYILFFGLFCLGNNAIVHLDRSLISETFIIPTRGMIPTILPGERIFVDRLWFSRRHIRRGDVVVFRSEGPGSPLFVQRVVGLPGEKIEIRNERLLINGAQWDDPHAVFSGPVPSFRALVDFGPARIPAGCYFLLGDNRRMSADSRTRGPIPTSDLCGVVRLIFWSHERTFPDPNDTTHYEWGPFHWDRLGRRLD